MNLINQLPKRYRIEIIETGDKTYGALLKVGSEIIGESSRCVTQSGAIYWAVKVAASRARHWRRFPELRRIIKSYEKKTFGT